MSTIIIHNANLKTDIIRKADIVVPVETGDNVHEKVALAHCIQKQNRIHCAGLFIMSYVLRAIARRALLGTLINAGTLKAYFSH